jgi:hypothetical protein
MKQHRYFVEPNETKYKNIECSNNTNYSTQRNDTQYNNTHQNGIQPQNAHQNRNTQQIDIQINNTPKNEIQTNNTQQNDIQLSLMFVDKVRSLPKSGAPERCFIWVGSGLIHKH